MKYLLYISALVAVLLAPTAAHADTPGCVSMAEYANTTRYLSAGQIANRYDTNGVYAGADSDEFKRSYDACWTSDRVIVWYAFANGLTTRWTVQ